MHGSSLGSFKFGLDFTGVFRMQTEKRSHKTGIILGGDFEVLVSLKQRGMSGLEVWTLG